MILFLHVLLIKYNCHSDTDGNDTMKRTCLLTAMLAMTLAGCGGDGPGSANDPVKDGFISDAGLWRPVVTSVTPTIATVGALTTFTVNGTLLNPNMAFAVTNCDGVKELGGGTDNARAFSCTPSGAPGTRAGRVAEKPTSTTALFAFAVTIQ